MGKQFLIAAGMADTRKPCSAVWGIVICGFKAGPPESLQIQKIFFVSVILVYFCGSEVLRNPGWIFHSWLTLSPSFSFVSLSASAKMSPWWSSWWIPGWLPPGGDGLLLSLLHAPAVSAVQSAGLTGSINHSWKARCSESSGPICDVLMWHSLAYTSCTWTGADWGGCGSQIWLPGFHMPLFGFEEAGLERMGTCCFSYCCFFSMHTVLHRIEKGRSCDLKKL